VKLQLLLVVCPFLSQHPDNDLSTASSLVTFEKSRNSNDNEISDCLLMLVTSVVQKRGIFTENVTTE